MVPAADLATSVGNARLENLAMFGAMVRLGLLKVKPETACMVIERSVPRGTEQMNVAAFHAGHEWRPSPQPTAVRSGAAIC